MVKGGIGGNSSSLSTSELSLSVKGGISSESSPLDGELTTDSPFELLFAFPHSSCNFKTWSDTLPDWIKATRSLEFLNPGVFGCLRERDLRAVSTSSF